MQTGVICERSEIGEEIVQRTKWTDNEGLEKRFDSGRSGQTMKDWRRDLTVDEVDRQ